ncbi:unnamed protein product [Closterium sp. NIES-53]
MQKAWNTQVTVTLITSRQSIHGSKDSIIIKIKDSNPRPRQVSPARDLCGVGELVTPRVRQAAEAALGGVQAPTLLTSAVSGTENVGAGASTSTSLTPSVLLTKLLRGGGLRTALLLLALTTTGATPLCNAATCSTTASAASATSSYLHLHHHPHHHPHSLHCLHHHLHRPCHPNERPCPPSCQCGGSRKGQTQLRPTRNHRGRPQQQKLQRARGGRGNTPQR